ncbi:MAG: terminase large subunit [Pseudomonadota bacterium]
MSTATFTPEQIKLWRIPTSEGFFAWLADTRPQVPSSKGGYETFVPGPREESEIRKALDGDYRTIVFCWPRRHGKTLVSALIICWRFLTRQTQTVGIIANSEKQTVDTAFKTVATILKQTPYMAHLVKSGAIKVQGDKIMYDKLHSVIQGYSANPAALYGKKLSIAQCSELHAAKNDEAYQALASATVDTDDGLTLVDSTVGPKSSPLYSLYNIAQRGEDESLFYSHIFYADLHHACLEAPHWIKQEALRSRAAQMLPAEFAQQHLNLWQSSQSSLFPPAVLDKCKDFYRLDTESIADGRGHVVGGGLDRAYGFSLHGDQTITTAVLKVLIGEEEHYYVLDSAKVAFSNAGGIKRNFSAYAKDFSMTRCTIEAYNSQDIAAWCADQDFDSETVNATSDRQSNAFTALFNAASEGRLHIHPDFKGLYEELSNFEYSISNNTSGGSTHAKFGGAKGCHDDRVYSLAWAVYSLRDDLLNPYEIEGIHCHGQAHVAPLCVLNGGDHVPPCAESCRSMLAAHKLYQGYRSKGQIDPDSFELFIDRKLINVGSHTMPR